MNLERITMLAALNLVRPALATKEIIPELAHVWFDGEMLTAYNDADLGIQVPFASPFQGGIRGQLLSGILSNSRAKEITLELLKDDQVLLKAARARIELAILAPERAVWCFPAHEPKKGWAMSEAFLGGLKAVLISVGNDTSLPEKQGVTLDCNGKGGLSLFTTDSKSIARYDLEDQKLKTKFHAIIPTAFCEQLLKLCGEGDRLELRQGKENCVIASNEAGVKLYARLVACEQPKDFFKIFEEQIPELADNGEHANLFEIPGKLALALERAIVVMEGASDPKFAVRSDAGKLIIEAEAEGRGDLVDDSVPLPQDVPDFGASIDPELIKRAIPITTHMAFGKCLYMDDGDGFSYLAAYRRH